MEKLQNSNDVGEDPDAPRYEAFISYRQVQPDRKWAVKLHREIENYRAPRRVARERQIQRKGRKLFRDVDELSATTDLSADIEMALRASRFLIVICSPRTPPSHWVSREIELFRQWGRSDNVLSVLIEGDPKDSFPPGLLEIRRTVLDAQGLTREEIERREPLAADVRPQPGESTRTLRRLAKLRLLAPMLGCSFDELRQRDQERRIWQLAWAGGALFALLLLVTGLALWAVSEQRRAELNAQREAHARQQGEKLIGFMISELRSHVQPLGKTEVLDAANEAVGAYYREFGSDRRDPESLWQEMVGLFNAGDNALTQADIKRAGVEYQAALTIARQQLIQRPGDTQWLDRVALALLKASDVFWNRRDFPAALAAATEGMDIARHLLAQEPHNSDHKNRLAAFLGLIGDLYFEQESLDKALQAREEATAIRRALAEAEPADQSLQQQLSVSLQHVAEVFLAKESRTQALAALKESLSIVEKLASQKQAKGPWGWQNPHWEQERAAVLRAMANVLDEKENAESALELAHEGLKIMEKLAESDAANTDWQRDLSASYAQMGRVLQTKGDDSRASAFFEKQLPVARKLAEHDRQNFAWQSGLATSLESVAWFRQAKDWRAASELYKEAIAVRRQLAEGFGGQPELVEEWETLGSLHRDHDDLRGALEAFQQGAQSAEAVAQKFSDDEAVQWDATRLTNAVGSMAYSLRDHDTAVIAFRKSLSICKRFAPQFLSDPGWQKAHFGNHNNLGLLLLDQGKTKEGMTHLQEGLSILAAVVKTQPDNIDWQLLLGGVYNNLGEWQDKLGHTDEALASYKQVQVIMEAGAKRDPDNTGWADGFGTASRHVGDILLAQGDVARAEEAYAQAFANHGSINAAEALQDALALKSIYEKRQKDGRLTQKDRNMLKMITDVVHAIEKDMPGSLAHEPFVGPRCNVVILSGHPSEAVYLKQITAALRIFNKTDQPPAHAFILGQGLESVVDQLKFSCEFYTPSRDSFLTLAKKLAASGAPVVVMVFGQSGMQGETPVFNIRAPHLTPTDFQEFADKLPKTGSHWALYFRGSGAFARAITAPGREIISSDSKGVAEATDPVGLQLLLEILEENPSVSTGELGQRLGQRTAAWYQLRQQIRTESPTLWLGTSAPQPLVSGDNVNIQWK